MTALAETCDGQLTMGIPLESTLRGTEDRLFKLIDERLEPGADTAAIDARIWNLFGEDWAIMATDLSGFSRRVADFGIIHFLQLIWEHKKLLFPIIERHDGILVKAEADSLLLLFRQPAQALACAIAMQHACHNLESRRVAEEQILLCVGIGYGRILRVGGTDVFGEEVNGASKLGEDTARAREILVTGAVYDAVAAEASVTFEPLDVARGWPERAFRVVYPEAR